MNSMILRTAARFLMTLLLLFSIFLLLRGHNEPGGGFVGGLVAASAFVLYSMATSPAAARAALRIDTRMFIGVGLLLSLSSGALPFIEGKPFLTALWWDINVFGMTHIELSSPLFFDIGVYLVVLGVSLTMMLALAEE
jgi:multicomponent Na+:H+ antiporter subunit B